MMRTKKLKNIKILVWDLDGTFYKPIAELSLLVEKRQCEVLSQAKKISFSAAKKLLRKKKKIYKSATKALFKLGCGEIADVARKIDTGGKHGLIKKDKALLEMFKALKEFRHLVLTNRAIKGTIEILKALELWQTGVLEKVFSAAEDFSAVKPDLLVFKKILDYSRLPADQHLMIGDRVEVDLLPAKKLGMRTCLVWQNNRAMDKNIDITIPTIYDIVKVLGKILNKPN